MARRVAPSRSRTRASDTACRSLVIWNIGKRLIVSVRRDLEHRETPDRVVWSRSRARQSHFACRLVEIQSPTELQVMQLHRNPELGQATRRAGASGFRARQSHFACRLVEIQSSTEPQVMQSCRNPALGRASLVCGCGDPNCDCMHTSVGRYSSRRFGAGKTQFANEGTIQCDRMMHKTLFHCLR
jgi:hypothetical protein